MEVANILEKVGEDEREIQINRGTGKQRRMSKCFICKKVEGTTNETYRSCLCHNKNCKKKCCADEECQHAFDTHAH